MGGGITLDEWDQRYRYTHMVATGPDESESEDAPLWEQRLEEIHRMENLRIGKSTTKGAPSLSEKLHWHNTRRGDEGTLTIPQWLDVKRRFNKECAYCGSKVATHLEHVVPVLKGGPTNQFNVVPSCARCNIKKYTRDPLEFLQAEGILEQFIERCTKANE